jgi:hypothetical protein
VSQGGCRDPKVVRADDFASGSQLRPDVGVNASDLLGDLKRPHPGEQMLDECAATRALRAFGAVDAVQEFTDRDHTDRAVLLTDGAINLRISDATLEVDQQPGVDQDGHGSSGAATDFRIASTSPWNSSSGIGAAAINSRKRAADISLPLGGEITATDAPLRVISISSPSATLFSTSEKLRAASVAVIRVTAPDYQINLIPHAPVLLFSRRRYVAPSVQSVECAVGNRDGLVGAAGRSVGDSPWWCHNEDGMATVLSPMIVHASRLPEELLARADLEHEPLVMLESTPDGALVRKLTPAEKVQYAERTGESVFFGSAAEMDEAVLGVAVDDPADE